MARRSFILALTLGGLALVGCSETTTPTQTEGARDVSPAAPSFALAPNSWTLKAPVPKPPPYIEQSSGRLGLAAGAANNAAGQPTVYIFGGVTTDYSYHPFGIDAYNPSTNTWTKRGGFGRAFTNGVGRIGNKLYISGGGFYGDVGEVEVGSLLFAYDPAANRLTSKANMPRPTAEGVTGVINGKLYVLAGFCINTAGQQVDCRSLYRYDPGTNRWATLPRAPHPHRNGAAAVINGKFYVAGGGWRSTLANLDVYDPATNTWKALAPMPEARSHVAGAVLNGKLHVMGGVGPSGSHTKVFAYNPVTNQWQVRASLLKGRDDLAATQITLLNGQSHIFALGGCCHYRGQNEMYTP